MQYSTSPPAPMAQPLCISSYQTCIAPCHNRVTAPALLTLRRAAAGVTTAARGSCNELELEMGALLGNGNAYIRI